MAFYALTQELGSEAPDPTKTRQVEVTGVNADMEKVFEDKLLLHPSVGGIKGYSAQKFAGGNIHPETILRFDIKNTNRYLESFLQEDGTIGLRPGYEKS